MVGSAKCKNLSLPQQQRHLKRLSNVYSTLRSLFSRLLELLLKELRSCAQLHATGVLTTCINDPHKSPSTYFPSVKVVVKHMHTEWLWFCWYEKLLALANFDFLDNSQFPWILTLT